MGLFSRTKKNVPAPTATSSAILKPLKPGLIESFILRRHQTGLLKYGTKDENGWPTASQMYWNTSPPTFCPEVFQNSVFDVDDEDAECYDKDELLNGRKKVTHIFNVEYISRKNIQNTVRPVGISPDYALIRSWLGQCEKEHNQCRANGHTGKLKLITLVDVRARRLVQYQPGMQYVALSYVWGRGIPKPRRGRPHELPSNISKTIQHAMVVTENIGVCYLWADAVCINQHDPQDQKEQIPLMDYIYEQAFATIVALGDHANIGLPGVDDGPRRHRQMVAEFGPVRLLSRCPTLSSQIDESVWSTRGWTYQEGLFSRRCIYFSQHQVYFHCTRMLCTEDLPSAVYVSEVRDPKSIAHQNHYWNDDKFYIRENTLWASPMIGNFYLYISYLGRYVYRDITCDKDAVNAFGAVLSRMERDVFRNGFIYGVPRDAFREGLLWAAAAPISRRKPGAFPNDFPSWSWAGWKTGESAISYAPVHLAFDDSYTVVPYPLSISFGQDCLFRSQTSSLRLSGIALELQNLWETYSHSQKHSPHRAVLQPPASNALYVDGPVLKLPVTYDAETQVIGFTAPSHLSKVNMMRLTPMLGEKCSINFRPESLPVPQGAPISREFLVMRTKHFFKFVVYEEIEFTLMMLEWTGTSVATRAGILQLNIAASLGEFWKLAGVKRDAFWLV
ncbi:HET-domain-containing protein [Karstenula rhodostoma CBS 690.94]|uniref:HET-domain-containing protein n=1 Tax=Karstenula rhodostoma CBS 690.94 TaxID=1392251 RepID=A0A9P4PVN1_9PLEO|nr:HET-domain-containing protein [Karstenula rhodostoma CBS 690.94]